MVDFMNFKLNDMFPIYVQLIRYVKMGIISGRLKNGDEMPSRRLLSASLGVNPNTIQKAYRDMEEEGILISYAGSKSILNFDDEKIEKIRQDILYSDTEAYVEAIKEMGLELEETYELIKQIWNNYKKGV